MKTNFFRAEALHKGKRREIAILALCLLIGFALRFYTFDRKSLWGDEVYTFNDSRYGLADQISFYKQNPTFLHPPLFFLLTHLSYPFPRPERDLRIVPLIFGILSIPMIYLLSRSFSTRIAPWCTLCFSLMAYHISLSQDGRSYSMILFLGTVALYFLITYLRTLKRRYLLPVAFSFAAMFHTSYSSVPFIALSQVLWFYRAREDEKKPDLASFVLLNGLTLILCAPWMLFLIVNYKNQPLMDPFHQESPGTPLSIAYGLFQDWLPHAPLMIASLLLFICFPFFSKNRRNALVLISAFVLPIVGLYLFCRLMNLTHFVSSRYLVGFLPLFLIALFLSLLSFQQGLERLEKAFHLQVLFVILFIASNLVYLPFYYRAEKQDFRGLVTYLKGFLREGDNILDADLGYGPGILHYFRVYPEGRQYVVNTRRVSQDEMVFWVPFEYRNKKYTIYNSRTCCAQYVSDGRRLWIVAKKDSAKRFKEDYGAALMGYFDGSFLNFSRFPTDASFYLLLLDPRSPNAGGLNIPLD